MLSKSNRNGARMTSTPLKILGTLALAATTSLAQAGLILDTAVTAAFVPGATTTNTIGNDLPAPRPNTLYFGQLRATSAGFVDFFYVGNEASYTNRLIVGESVAVSTTGLSDTFYAPHELVGSLAVSAGDLLDFGFCTTGGDAVLGSRCVWNDSAASIITQYNYGLVGGYRSIGYAGLSNYDPTTGARTFTAGSGGDLNNWMAFWDDSGAKNDDNHDDLIIGLKFRPTAVDEPGSIGLAVIGLFGLLWATRRKPLAARR